MIHHQDATAPRNTDLRMTDTPVTFPRHAGARMSRSCATGHRHPRKLATRASPMLYSGGRGLPADVAPPDIGPESPLRLSQCVACDVAATPPKPPPPMRPNLSPPPPEVQPPQEREAVSKLPALPGGTFALAKEHPYYTLTFTPRQSRIEKRIPDSPSTPKPGHAALRLAGGSSAFNPAALKSPPDTLAIFKHDPPHRFVT